MILVARVQLGRYAFRKSASDFSWLFFFAIMPVFQGSPRTLLQPGPHGVNNCNLFTR